MANWWLVISEAKQEQLENSCIVDKFKYPFPKITVAKLSDINILVLFWPKYQKSSNYTFEEP